MSFAPLVVVLAGGMLVWAVIDIAAPDFWHRMVSAAKRRANQEREDS